MNTVGLPRGIGGMRGRGFCGSALVVGAGALVWVWHWHKCRQLRRKAIEKREKEQEYILQRLRSLSDSLDQDEVERILKLTLTELQNELRNGNVTPINVLQIYTCKACQVTTSLNCLTEVIKGCEDVARKLSEKNPKDYPLYGLPVSLKECMKTKGTPSTAGLAMYLDQIPTDDCVIAKVLKHCGAVPFVKTNIPQMMLSFESSNPIFGETSNPLNRNFAPGGSSAGEAALIAAGGSALGFGTDIAGSIRVPAHFCGICGLKPTKYRLSSTGLTGSLPGQSAIAATLGPMARDVDTLVMAMRALLCDTMFSLDRSVVPLRFNEEVYTSRKPMRIGYYEDDGYMEPVPACKRAVRITKEALEKAGHTLVPYKVPDIEILMEMTSKACYADGGRTNVERLRNDIVDKRLMHTFRRWKTPPGIRKLHAMFMGHQSTRMAKDVMAYGGGDKSAYSLWKLTAELEAYKTKFWSEWREKYKIDALICPVFALVACPKGTMYSMTAWMSYSIPYTAANCPAGTVTVTKVTEKDIKDLDGHRGHYGDHWDRLCKSACTGSINMPVGVQCVSPPWQEEVCLRLMKEVETLLVK